MPHFKESNSRVKDTLTNKEKILVHLHKMPLRHQVQVDKFFQQTVAVASVRCVMYCLQNNVKRAQSANLTLLHSGASPPAVRLGKPAKRSLLPFGQACET